MAPVAGPALAAGLAEDCSQLVQAPVARVVLLAGNRVPRSLPLVQAPVARVAFVAGHWVPSSALVDGSPVVVARAQVFEERRCQFS